MKTLNPMVPSLLLNLAIVALVAGAVYFTTNPMALFALMLLRDMPVVMPDDGDDSGSMGFVN